MWSIRNQEKFELGKIAGKQGIKQSSRPAFGDVGNYCAAACAESGFIAICKCYSTNRLMASYFSK
jgi:hypothetical protein